MEDKSLELARRFSEGAVSKVHGGEIGCSLYRIRYADEDAVIKIGFKGQISGDEVDSNLIAYREMAELRATNIAPRIFAEGAQEDLIYLIIEYLGQDFKNSAAKGRTGKMTEDLISSLKDVYMLSRRKDSKGSQRWLNKIKHHMIQYYTNYLEPAGYIRREDISFAESVEVRNISPDYVALATSDLTPDNVFMKNGRAVLIDPKPGLLGSPLIDLAMFSTLAGEVYNLPEGEESSALIRNFAFSMDLREILECNNGLIKKLFKFGEARQYSLSSRFRIGKDPRAELFAKKSISKLREIFD